MTDCPPSTHCPSPVEFVTPPVWLFDSSAEDRGLQTVGKLDVHLNGSEVERPSEGAAGWFAQNFGMFRKQVEKYSSIEYLDRVSRFLSDTELKNIMLLEIDYTRVYSDKQNKNSNDLDDAVKAANEYLSQNIGNKMVVSALGKSDDFELAVEVQFYRTHGYGKPSIEIKVVGIASILLKQDKEAEEDYRARLEKLSGELNDEKRKDILMKYEDLMGIILADYKKHLTELFDLENTVQNVWTE